PASPSYLDHSLVVPFKHDSATARRQDALGSMLWLGLNPDTAPRGQILMPPLFWDLKTQDPQAVLTALATPIHAGLSTPRPLGGMISGASATAVPSAQPLSDAEQRGHIDPQIAADMGRQVGRLWGFTAALSTDARTGLTGTQYTAPLREDMLRSLSQAIPPDS